MDVFVHDRLLGDTRMVSDFAGSEFDGPSISRNGRLVAFSSDAPLVRGDTNDAEDIFVRNLETGKIRRVSVDSRGRQARCFVGSVEDVPFCSRRPSISPDGRFVAFASDSPDLVSGDTIPRSVDIFVHDLVSGRTRRASVTARGRQRRFAYADEYSFPAMANRYVAFVASADLLRGKASHYQDVFVRGPLRPIHLGSG